MATHKTNVSELDGIGRQMPFTMLAFTLGALSMIGIPPLGGFISKWYLALGAIEAHQFPIIVVLAASTILNACYFMPIVYAAFFKEPAPDPHHHGNPHNKIHEAPVLMVVPLVLTATGALVLFFWPTFFLNIARIALQSVTGGN